MINTDYGSNIQNIYTEATILYNQLENNQNHILAQAKVQEFFNRSHRLILPGTPELKASTANLDSDELRSKLAHFMNQIKSDLLQFTPDILSHILHFTSRQELAMMERSAKSLSELADREILERLNNGDSAASLGLHKASLIRILNKYLNDPIYSLNIDISVQKITDLFPEEAKENHRFRFLHTLCLPYQILSPEDIFLLASYSLKNLTRLNLRIDPKNNEALRAFTETLKAQKNLKHLTLSLYGTLPSQEGLDEFLDALNFLPGLESLELCIHDFLGLIDIDPLPKIALTLQSLPNLKLLNLRFSSVGEEDGQTYLLFQDGLKELVNLEELHFESRNLPDNLALGLANSLPYLTNLKVLNLDSSDNGLNLHPYIEDFTEALKTATTLEKLYLGGQPIMNDDDIHYMIEALKNLPNLTILDLAATELTDEGTTLLVETLKPLENLDTLSLSYNGGITSSAIPALADLLDSNENLTTLNLSDTKIAYYQKNLKALLKNKGAMVEDGNESGFKLFNIQRPLPPESIQKKRKIDIS